MEEVQQPRTIRNLVMVRARRLRRWLHLPHAPYVLVVAGFVGIWIAFAPANSLIDWAIWAPREDLGAGMRRVAVISAFAFFPANFWSWALAPTLVLMGILHKLGRTDWPRIALAVVYAAPLLLYLSVLLIAYLVSPI